MTRPAPAGDGAATPTPASSDDGAAPAAPDGAAASAAASPPTPVPDPVFAAGRWHLIGIGGVGMAAVAELAAADGVAVSGSDARDSATLTRLRAAGIDARVGHEAPNVTGAAVVVLSSAVRPTNPELLAAREAGIPVRHRSQALAALTAGRELVAVAGAHGKTTTSAMLAVALRGAGLDPSWAIGGEVVGAGTGAHLGSGAVFVAEADESDGSFLNYAPTVAVVTNVEADHLDTFGSVQAFEDAFVRFAERIVPTGTLVACADDPGALRLAERHRAAGGRAVTYGIGPGADVRVATRAQPGGTQRVEFAAEATRLPDLSAPAEPLPLPVTLDLPAPGTHNALNAAAAWIAGCLVGADGRALARALGEFTGTRRRFEERGRAAGVRVVDDYAHHPTEIEALLAAARATLEPGGRLVVLFQPHLYSRTRLFADRFAEALSGAEEVVVTDVYAAREDPEPGVTGATITDRTGGRAVYVPDRLDAAREAARRARGGDLVLTVGAGDVTELAPVVLEELTARRGGDAG